MPSERLYQLTHLPTVLKRVPLSRLCHFSLDPGFNTADFRALMKSTSVTHASISTLITCQEQIQQPPRYFRNHFLIRDFLHHIAQASTKIHAYLGISGIFTNIGDFAASLDFRLSCLFSRKGLIIYSQEILKSKNIILPLLSSWILPSHQSRIFE